MNKADKTLLYNHRLQNIAIMIYRALNNIAPSYIKDLVNTRNTNYQLRGSNILSVPRINTTSYGFYGFKSIRYFGPKIWNFLDDNLLTQSDLQSFKKFVRLVDFGNNNNKNNHNHNHNHDQNHNNNNNNNNNNKKT